MFNTIESRRELVQYLFLGFHVNRVQRKVLFFVPFYVINYSLVFSRFVVYIVQAVLLLFRRRSIVDCTVRLHSVDPFTKFLGVAGELQKLPGGPYELPGLPGGPLEEEELPGGPYGMGLDEGLPGGPLPGGPGGAG